MRKLLLITGCCMATTLSVSACGPNGSCTNWWNANKETFQYVAIQGQEVFVSLVKTTIKSLNELYNQNPQAFMQFVQVCLDDGQAVLPTEFYDSLKTFNLIDSSGNVTDMLKLIVADVVEPLSDGTFKIWNLTDLIGDGWMTPIITAMMTQKQK
jgi:hypothetical protein